MVSGYGRTSGLFLVVAVLMGAWGASHRAAAGEKTLRAGAAAVDVTPTKLPAIVSGGFLSREANSVTAPLFARSLVLDDGTTRIAICVVDTLFMSREFLEGVKKEASNRTGIPAERMLISATHTHTAPSVLGALGTGVDENYASLLPGWIVQSIEQAAKTLVPVEAGWAVVQDSERTHCRQWILRPDRMRHDPFGQITVRSQMHPGYQNPDFLGPSGPVDPDLTVLSFRARDGRPVAMLTNYSMHYFGDAPISPDYLGRLSMRLAELIGGDDPNRRPVVLPSQGTSGDQHWMDYSQPAKKIDIKTYTEALAQEAFAASKTIRYQAGLSLGMAERKITLGRRVPDARRLEWARAIVAQMGDRPPRSQPEVYAREQIYLHEEPRRELILQAVRIGDLGITAIPDEVFAITGLKLKAQSPLAGTMNIELANGGDGYIPPPEQHPLGGYTTWPARSAGLEVQAEPKIVETLLSALEEVSGKPRRKPADVHGPYAKAVLGSKPFLYWRLSEFQGLTTADATGQGHTGTLEGLHALYLDGPQSPGFSVAQVNRAVHFVGGRIRTNVPDLKDTYSVELWFYNALPCDARAVTGSLVARGGDEVMRTVGGDILGIGGTDQAPGKLIFYSDATPKSGATLAGRTDLAVKTWYHVVLVREGKGVKVYLNGARTPEIAGEIPPSGPSRTALLFFGGRNDNQWNLEGRADEVSVYLRALSPDEIQTHFQAAGMR